MAQLYVSSRMSPTMDENKSIGHVLLRASLHSQNINQPSDGVGLTFQGMSRHFKASLTYFET